MKQNSNFNQHQNLSIPSGTIPNNTYSPGPESSQVQYIYKPNQVIVAQQVQPTQSADYMTTPRLNTVQVNTVYIMPATNQIATTTLFENICKTSSVEVFCPFCRKNTFTKVDTSLNCLNCLCCCFTGFFPWLIFQAVRSKDINCKDANHVCPGCGRTLHIYSAC